MTNVWPFPPQRELKERVDWKTEVIRCRAGEQRICLRSVPRTEIELDFQFLPGEIEAATTMARQWGADEFYLPLWHDHDRVGALAPGQTTITLDTTKRRYVDGGKAFLMDQDGGFEVVDIVAVTPTELQLAEPYVVYGYGNAVVAPCHPAHFKDPFGFRKFSAEYFTGSAEFILTADLGVAGANPFPTFEDAYVLSDRPLTTSSSKEVQQREFEGFPNLAGPIFYSKSYTYPVGSSNMTWSFDSREELWAFRQWMQVVKGKQGSFYAPRWTRDFVLDQASLAADDFLYVKQNGFQDHSYTGPVCLVRADGTLKFLRVTGWAYEGPGIDRMLLDAPLGEDVDTQDVELITRMPRMRFNSDRIEYAYKTGGSIDVRLPVMEVPE